MTRPLNIYCGEEEWRWPYLRKILSLSLDPPLTWWLILTCLTQTLLSSFRPCYLANVSLSRIPFRFWGGPFFLKYLPSDAWRTFLSQGFLLFAAIFVFLVFGLRQSGHNEDHNQENCQDRDAIHLSRFQWMDGFPCQLRVPLCDQRNGSIDRFHYQVEWMINWWQIVINIYPIRDGGTHLYACVPWFHNHIFSPNTIKRLITIDHLKWFRSVSIFYGNIEREERMINCDCFEWVKRCQLFDWLIFHSFSVDKEGDPVPINLSPLKGPIEIEGIGRSKAWTLCC